MIDTEVVSEIPDTLRWDDCIEKSQSGTVFHRSELLRTLEDVVDFRFVLAHKEGTLVGVLPLVLTDHQLSGFEYRALSSPPLIEHGGPVVFTDHAIVVDAFEDAVSQFAASAGVPRIEIQTNQAQTRYFRQLRDAGYRPYVSTTDMVIDLDTDIESIVARASKERRREVRRAIEDTGLTVHASMKEKFDVLYDCYVGTMSDIGVDPYPASVIRSLIDAASTDVFTATIDGSVVGWFLHCLGDETVHHLVSASAREYHSRYVVQYLHYRSLEHYLENGYRHYHLGGTPADTENGHYAFKQRWSPRHEVKVTWVRYCSTPLGVVNRFKRFVQLRR